MHRLSSRINELDFKTQCKYAHKYGHITYSKNGYQTLVGKIETANYTATCSTTDFFQVCLASCSNIHARAVLTGVFFSWFHFEDNEVIFVFDDVKYLRPPNEKVN